MTQTTRHQPGGAVGRATGGGDAATRADAPPSATGATAGEATTAPDDGHRALARSAAVMASGTLVSRLLGLLRNALLVAVVGATLGIADAWSVSNKLPNIISMLLAGGVLNAVLVPQIVRAMRRRDGGEEYVNRLLTAAIAILAGLTLVLTAAASVLVTIYAATWSPEWKAVAVALAYWCLPQLFFYGLYTLLGQVLNARGVFGPYMWAPVANNVVAIAGLVAFLVIFGALPDGGLPASAWTSDRILLLGGTATLGVVVQALVLIVPLHRSGFRFRPVWGLRGHGLGTASTVASWAFAALAVGQVGYLAVSNLAAAAGAAGLEAGERFAGNFAYDNAFLVFMLPQSLVTVSLVTALFTRVAQNAAGRDGAAVRDDLSLGLRTLSVFTVLATAGFAVLAIPLVQLVTLDRATGGFADYRAIGAVLVAMSFGLVSIAVWTMVQRVFYAYEDTRSLFRLAIPMAGVLVVGCGLSWWLLEPQWWVAGAGAATTLSNTLGATVGYLATRKYLPSLDGGRVFRTHLRVVLAVLPPALLAWGLLHLWGVQTTFLGALARVLVLGALIVAGYLVLLRVLRVSEVEGLTARIRRPLDRLLRRGPAPVAAGGPAATTTDDVSTMTATSDRATGEQHVGSTSDVALRAGHLLATRFRLDEQVGADLWTGTDVALDEPVRVQLLDGPARDGAIDAARRVALLEDPRLPRVLRAGVEQGRGYVVTQAATGPTLAQLVAAGPLAPSQARALVGEAAAALESARRRGVHHLALHPSALVRTEDGEVRLTGLGTDAALHGTELRDAHAAGRRDAVGLVHLLYTALTATWPGAAALADGVPAAARHDAGVVPAGDVVSGVPNDLDTLCAVTLGEHDDGPHTPGELVADLAPWGAIDTSVPVGALPPVVHPTPREAGTAAFLGGWAAQAHPAGYESTPLADLVIDTGTLPAQLPPPGFVAAAAAPVDPAPPVRVSALARDEAGPTVTVPVGDPDEDGAGREDAAERADVASADESDGTGEPGAAGPPVGDEDAAGAQAAGADDAATADPTGDDAPSSAPVGDPAVGDVEPDGSAPDDATADDAARVAEPDDAEPGDTPETTASQPDGTGTGGDSTAGATAVDGAGATPDGEGPAGLDPGAAGLASAMPVAGVTGGAAAAAALAVAAREAQEAAEETRVAAPVTPAAPHGGADPVPGGAPDEPTSAPGLGGYPLLATSPLGWDVPGGAAPATVPADPEPVAAAEPVGVEPVDVGSVGAELVDVEPTASAPASPALRTGEERREGGVLVGGIRGTNRRINEVSEKVGGSARRLVGGAGERVGAVTHRAGAFVRDVREEFEPEETGEDGRGRFNPAPYVLAAMVAIVIFGLIMAVLTLRDAATAFQPGSGDPTVVAPTTEPAEDDEAPAEPEPDPEEPAEGDLPPASAVAVESAMTFDPTVQGGENQADAYLAHDGNPETSWNSLRYNSPTYGMKNGLGYTVVLAETAVVSSVTLDVAGEGGLVEIRVGNADSPNAGDVLASGAMGPDVTYTFETPVEADAISLWFPELPVASSDGRNRIELVEITLG